MTIKYKEHNYFLYSRNMFPETAKLKGRFVFSNITFTLKLLITIFSARFWQLYQLKQNFTDYSSNVVYLYYWSLFYANIVDKINFHSKSQSYLFICFNGLMKLSTLNCVHELTKRINKIVQKGNMD